MKKCAVVAKKCAGVAKKCAGVAKKCAGVAKKCAGVAKKCAGEIKKCAGVAKKCAGVAKKCAGVAKKCAGVEDLGDFSLEIGAGTAKRGAKSAQASHRVPCRCRRECRKGIRVARMAAGASPPVPVLMNTDAPPALPPAQDAAPASPEAMPSAAPAAPPGARSVPKWNGKLKDVALVLASVPRWSMLRELAATEWLTVGFLARRAGLTRAAASKHVALLLKKKVIERGPSRLIRLVAPLRPPPGADWLDFGWCRVRWTPPA